MEIVQKTEIWLEPIRENKRHKKLGNFEIQTDDPIKARR